MMKVPGNSFGGSGVSGMSVDSLTHLVDVDTRIVNEDGFEQKTYVLTNDKGKERTLFEFKELKDILAESNISRDKDVDYLLEKVLYLEEIVSQLANEVRSK